MNTIEKKKNSGEIFFFEKNSKFFSKFIEMSFFRGIFTKVFSSRAYAETPRTRINRILIKGPFGFIGFIGVHLGPSEFIRCQAESSVIMRVSRAVMRTHAVSCEMMSTIKWRPLVGLSPMGVPLTLLSYVMVEENSDEPPEYTSLETVRIQGIEQRFRRERSNDEDEDLSDNINQENRRDGYIGIRTRGTSCCDCLCVDFGGVGCLSTVP